MNAPVPPNEAERLRELNSYEILDTPPEVEFDDIVRLAGALCNCPIAAISLVDAERQWFKARIGLPAAETSRDVAFCAQCPVNKPRRPSGARRVTLLGWSQPHATSQDQEPPGRRVLPDRRG